MIKLNLKIVIIHVILMVTSFLLIKFLDMPVPNINLKNGFQITIFDYFCGTIFTISVLVVYLVIGWKLETKSPKNKSNGISILLSVLYLGSTLWIVRNMESLSFTANDPTPEPAMGGVFGEVALGFSVIFIIPIEMFLWLPAKFLYFSKFFLLVMSQLPCLAIEIGRQFRNIKS